MSNKQNIPVSLKQLEESIFGIGTTLITLAALKRPDIRCLLVGTKVISSAGDLLFN